MMVQGIGLERHRRQMIRVNKAGWASAILLGGFHLMWAIIVASGFGQPLMEFIFWLHFIRPVYVIEAFDPPRSWVGAADGHSWLRDWERLCALVEPYAPPSSLTMRTNTAS